MELFTGTIWSWWEDGNDYGVSNGSAGSKGKSKRVSEKHLKQQIGYRVKCTLSLCHVKHFGKREGS